VLSHHSLASLLSLSAGLVEHFQIKWGQDYVWWDSDVGKLQKHEGHYLIDCLFLQKYSAKFGGAMSPLAPYVPPGLPCLILKATRHFLIDDLVVGGCRVFHSNY
jgi:hypothetical protein